MSRPAFSITTITEPAPAFPSPAVMARVVDAVECLRRGTPAGNDRAALACRRIARDAGLALPVVIAAVEALAGRVLS